jgi:hypothetical protein
MGKGSLSYAATVILQAISSGYLYGFDIIDITGLPGGTVYPALRRSKNRAICHRNGKSRILRKLSHARNASTTNLRDPVARSWPKP